MNSEQVQDILAPMLLMPAQSPERKAAVVALAERFIQTQPPIAGNYGLVKIILAYTKYLYTGHEADAAAADQYLWSTYQQVCHGDCDVMYDVLCNVMTAECTPIPLVRDWLREQFPPPNKK